jgi:hypothetical protein
MPKSQPATDPVTAPGSGALLPEVAGLPSLAGPLAPPAAVPEPVLDHRNAPVAGVVRRSGEVNGFTATTIMDDDVQVFVRPVATNTETGVELVDALGNLLGAAKTRRDPTVDVSGCYVEPDVEAAGE